jgi:transaldolase
MAYKSPLEEMAKTTPTEFWNDNCSPEDIAYAISHGAVGATTNPVIVGQVLSKDLDKYATTGSDHYCRMVECIRQKMNFTSLKYTTIEDLITSIGLPKERICTHCYDGSSQF